MTWQDYYDKFFVWAESTQVNRISSLADVGPFEELLEITENLDEKGASKLIRKALGHNMTFNAEQITQLSEYLEKELLNSLILSCKEPFTPEQLSHIEDSTMLYAHELRPLLSAPLNFDNLTWAGYYSIFQELSDEDAIRGANAISDFSATDEVKEAIFCLAYIDGAEPFILRALEHLTLSAIELEELIEFGNKKLNRHLVFEHLALLKKAIPLEDFADFKDYMFKEDFRKLERQIGPAMQPYGRPRKMGLMTKLGAVILITKAINHLLSRRNRR